MNLRLWIIECVGLLCFLLFSGCVEKFDEELWNEYADKSSSSRSSDDSLEYVEPPLLNCKEIIAQQEYDKDGNVAWNYNYSVKAFAFWNNETMRFTANGQILKNVSGENLWTNVSVLGDSLRSEYSFAAQKDSIILVKRFQTYIDEESGRQEVYSLCQTMDMGESWTCDKTDTADFKVVSDGMYFYFQRGSLQQYSLDGVAWNDFHLSRSVGIENAFVVDSTHFFYVDGSDLFRSTDFQSWDSTHVPVKQSGTKVVYGNGVFVYAGAWNELKYSTDLVTWTNAKRVCPSCGGSWFSDVVFEDGMFVVVGSATEMSTTKVVMTSYNGQDFEEQDACGTADDYDDVFYDRNGHFYITNGYDYNIFQKDPF